MKKYRLEAPDSFWEVFTFQQYLEISVISKIICCWGFFRKFFYLENIYLLQLCSFQDTGSLLPEERPVFLCFVYNRIWLDELLNRNGVEIKFIYPICWMMGDLHTTKIGDALPAAFLWKLKISKSDTRNSAFYCYLLIVPHTRRLGRKPNHDFVEYVCRNAPDWCLGKFWAW